MKLDIYVNYPGTCREAFSFYEQHLGGKITMMLPHAGQPANANAPAESPSGILHARIEIGNTVLMGADIPHAEPMRSAYLTLRSETAEETERIYSLLAESGQVFMKLTETDFAARFAILRDKFGTNWMLLHEK